MGVVGQVRPVALQCMNDVQKWGAVCHISSEACSDIQIAADIIFDISWCAS